MLLAEQRKENLEHPGLFFTHFKRMFLTLALLRKGIPGRQWIGKTRRPRQVTWNMRRNLLERLEREAENEYWLSRPYLSTGQEAGHAHARRQLTWEQIRLSRQAVFPQHKSISEHLRHLNVTRTWS